MALPEYQPKRWIQLGEMGEGRITVAYREDVGPDEECSCSWCGSPLVRHAWMTIGISNDDIEAVRFELCGVRRDADLMAEMAAENLEPAFCSDCAENFGVRGSSVRRARRIADLVFSYFPNRRLAPFAPPPFTP